MDRVLDGVTRREFVAGLSATAFVFGPTVVSSAAEGGTAGVFGAGARPLGSRIARLLARMKDHDVRPPAVPVAYDPADLMLPEPVRIGKRLKEYMTAQPVTLRADEQLVGWLTFDGSVESDLFPRTGHKAFDQVCGKYYRNPQDGLATFEWQHSCIDFRRLIAEGLAGLRAEVVASRAKWAGHRERLDYLKGMELALDGLEARARNCAAECRRQAAAETDGARKARHREHVGVDNAAILRNLRWLDAHGAKIVLRCPMIPGVNDFAANLDAIGRLADELKGVREVNVGPYVPYGIDKAHKLGLKVYEAPRPPAEYGPSIVTRLSGLTRKKVCLS